MALLATLREFTLGKLTREQLLAEFDSSLSHDLSDSSQLRAAIDEVSHWDRFPRDITHVLETRLIELDLAAGAHRVTADETQPSRSGGAIGAYASGSASAFVSYADEDSNIVAEELGWLRAQGFHLSSRELLDSADAAPTGDATRLIGECTVLLYFLSPASATDQRARRELALAIDQGKTTIIVHLEPTDLPTGLKHSIENLPGIRRYDYTAADYQRLLANRLQQALSASSSAAMVQGSPAAVHSLTPADNPKVGDFLDGRFELLEEIGEGGMSIVFKATDHEAYGKPQVAVKVLSPAFARHPDSLITLKREAAKSRALTHPNIVNVYDFVTSKHKYMWMEYLPGRSLAQRLREGSGRIGQSEAEVIIEGIANALTYAHANKIVHADFKPANVMLTEEPVTDPHQVKVIDLGIAQAIRNPGEDDGKTIFDIRSLHAFTIGYASPQLIDNAAADPRDDIYAFACIAYEMLTGRHPFNRESAQRAQQKSMQLDPRPELTRHQFRAIQHGLNFERDGRTDSAQEFLREFTDKSWQPSLLSRKALRKGLAGIAVTLLLAVGASQFDSISSWFDARPLQPGDQLSDCSECPQLTVLPSGRFHQGRAAVPGIFRSETPQRIVTISNPLAAGTTEVTVAEFQHFARETGFDEEGCTLYRDGQWMFDPSASWSNPGFTQSERHPVTCVTWSAAQAYAAWLTSATGENYRLPSASEWEYLATSGGTMTATIARELCSQANVADAQARAAYAGWDVHACDDGFVFTAPVGTFPANALGISDALGNVFEWVADCWHPNYDEAPVDGSAWLAGDCSKRELRGGSWYTQPSFANTSFRNHMAATQRSSSIGFRVVRDIKVANSGASVAASQAR